MIYFILIQVITLVIFQHTVIFKVLEGRLILFNTFEKNIIIFILMVLDLWAFFYYREIIYIYSVVFSIPILTIVSITDINQRLVFDRDIICGIIVEIGIISVGMFYNSLDSGKTSETSFLLNGLYYNRSIIEIIIGMILLGMLNYILYKTTGAMGDGDIVYFLYASCFANIFGCIFIFFASFISCFLYCIVYRIKNKNFGDGLISFTPFISIGIIIFRIVYM